MGDKVSKGHLLVTLNSETQTQEIPKKNIEEKSNQKQASIKEESKTSDMVSSLDEFLHDDELNR